MSKTRRNTSSPRRRPSSPKPKRPSPSSKRPEPAARRSGSRFAKAAGILASAAIILFVVAAGIWFASADWRADKAQAYDVESRELLKRRDVDGGYQQARLAYAISPEPDRALSLGSLAYLRGDYQGALDAFGRADGNYAALGRAAAGAQADEAAYETARDELGEPEDTVVRLGLSHAAVDAADFPTAKRLSEGARTIVGAYPFVLAESIENPDRTARDLRAVGRTVPQVIHPDPTVAAFLNELTAVPADARTEIGAALRNMAAADETFSRRVMRGSLLLGLDEFAAARRIGVTAAGRRPDYRDAWNLRAASDLALREYDDARRAVDISIELDPGFGYSWYLKSRLEEAGGDRKKADEYRLRAKLLGFVPPAG